jgi:PII-like signaling protein
MLHKGAAKKVTIYVNEDAQHHHAPLYDAVLRYLMQKGVAGATASRAIAGFGSHHVKHTVNIEALAEHLPIRIEFIESAERVDEILPALYDMVTDGTIEVHDTTVVKTTSTGRNPEPPLHHERTTGRARLMRVYMGESDRWDGEPLYEAIVKRLRLMDISGATVYKGLLGYGAKGHTHKSGLLPFSHDFPIMITVVDSEEKISAAVEAVEKMMADGLIVLSDVDYIRLLRRPEA